MSKPIIAKVTGLLHIDDLEVFAKSQSKFKCVLRDIVLPLNHKKCNVVNVKQGELRQDAKG